MFFCRALRRVEKGTMTNVEIAYRRAHSGSRGTLALEYSIYQLISVITKEFLHSELAYSLPYKIVLSIISKRVLLIIETVSSPVWILKNLLNVLNSTPNETEEPVKDVIFHFFNFYFFFLTLFFKKLTLLLLKRVKTQFLQKLTRLIKN